MEWEHIEEGEEALVSFMEKSGFVNFGKIATTYARDVIFVKDFLRFVNFNFFGFLPLKKTFHRFHCLGICATTMKTMTMKLRKIKHTCSKNRIINYNLTITVLQDYNP